MTDEFLLEIVNGAKKYFLKSDISLITNDSMKQSKENQKDIVFYSQLIRQHQEIYEYFPDEIINENCKESKLVDNAYFITVIINKLL
jgi:hypothetical protein